MEREPTYLFGAGATKAGTSWLYRYLAAHPECHLRSVKELHYFDTLEAGTQGRWSRMLMRKRRGLRQAQGAESRPWQRRMRRGRIRDLAALQALVAQGTDDPDALRRYLTDGLGDRHLVADITPAYGLLPVDRLRAMQAVGRDVRWVYLMRDPVDRLWSQVRMMAARRASGAEDFARTAEALMRAELSRIESGVADREDYRGAVARLRAAVPDGRLLTMLHDDLMTEAGIARLCGFLGIAPAPADFARRVLEGRPLALAEELRARAALLLAPQYEFVAGLVPALPARWRQNWLEVS